MCLKIPRLITDEVLGEVKGEKGNVERWKQGVSENGENGEGGKAKIQGDRPVSLFQFLREGPVLRSILAEYEAKRATRSGVDYGLGCIE